jgi:hypothetical protein
MNPVPKFPLPDKEGWPPKADGVVLSEVRLKTIIIFPFLFFKKNTDYTDAASRH